MTANLLVVTSLLWLASLDSLLAAVEASQAVDKGDNVSQQDNVEGVAVAAPGESTREHMELHQVTHLDEMAVCNDGSPGAYYHRPGTAANSTRWVIRFLGGAWCWDGPSCAARNASTPYLMSTTALPACTSARTYAPGLPDVVLQSHGITSVEADLNPSFASWNHVHVWYCSSDSHLGDAYHGSGTKFAGWQFRGRRIAAAVIADLLTWRGLSGATHVLLTGDSAGGVGVMNLADRIASILREEAPDLESIKLFVDAGWFLDIPAYANRSDGMTFKKCAKALAASYGAVYDGSCEQTFPAGESWRCFFAQDCHAHLDTPPLFHEYLYDSANMGYDGVGSSPEAEDFRSHLEASLKLSEASSAWNGSCDNATDETGPFGSSSALAVEHQQVSSSISMKMPVTDAMDEGYGDRVEKNLTGVRSGNECGFDPASARQLAAVVTTGV
ncbi:g5506 [Coccomyxa elongata]